MIEIYKSEWCTKTRDMHDWGLWSSLRGWFNRYQQRKCDRCWKVERREVYDV